MTSRAEDGLGASFGRLPSDVIRAVERVKKIPGRSARDAFFEQAGFLKDSVGVWQEAEAESVAAAVNSSRARVASRDIWGADSAFP